jgi:RHS repeat-associated protein
MRILQIDGYNYDAAGNVLSDPINGLNTYSYDAEGRVATANNGTIAYLYDAEGRRVAKESVSTVLTFRGPIYTTTLTNQYVLGLGGEQLTELAYAGGKLLATYDNNGLHFHFTDWLGSRRLQASGTGLVEETCQSLPFGDGLSCTGPASDATEHHFTGKERDQESGLDYFGARYYASSMGRFMSPDWAATAMPVPYAKLDNPQSLNLYSYVGNNPLIRIDKDGHCWSWLQGACNAAEKLYHGVFTDYGFKTNAQVSQVNEQNRQWLIQNNVVTPDKNGNTIDWNKASGAQVRTAYAGAVGAMILRLIHGPETISGAALNSVRKLSTEDIVSSLKNGDQPGIVKPDGTVMNGNTRLTVLQERGVDINSLGLKPDPMYEQFQQAEGAMGSPGAVPEEAPASEGVPMEDNEGPQ